MSKYYYKKRGLGFKKASKTLGFFFLFSGFCLLIYILSPLISWQFYFAPVFANQNFLAPIPKTTVANSSTFASLFTQASNNIFGVDYTNADNWFPQVRYEKNRKNVTQYQISIPKIGVEKAIVSTQDTNLSDHLVHFGESPLPGEKGGPIIFGHSTLPQLFKATDYKTIFANAYKLDVGDEIFAHVSDVTYEYKVFNVIVTESNDTSMFEQNFNDSFITLITCTPPGTTWKRLVIKAKIEKI